LTEKYIVGSESHEDDDGLTYGMDEGEEEQNNSADREVYKMEYIIASYLIQ
jgi:hypothetical protein